MILQILNLRFEELKRFPRIQKLIDDFVGKRLGNELEKEKDKSLEVILFYEKYIQYLIRKDICIYDEVHCRQRINGKYKRFMHTYHFEGRRGSINSICNEERKKGEYYRKERLATIWEYVHYRFHYKNPYDNTNKNPYDNTNIFIMIDIYCSYMSLFDKKENRYGKRIKRNISHVDGNKFMNDSYNVECKCNLCNHLHVI